MEYSKAIITFNSVPIGLSLLNITYNSTFEILEGFYAERERPYYCKIGVDAQDSAKNYYDAIVADYINAGLFTVSISANVVTITSTQLNTVFAIAPNNLIIAVTIDIVNATGQAEPIKITTNTFTRNAAEPELSVYNSVETNVLATMIDVGTGTFVANTSKPFQFIATRGVSYFVRVKDAAENMFSKDIKSPAVLNAGNIIVKVTNQPAGATVDISLYDDYGLTLQYSLNGTVWGNDSVFRGILPGNYTIYVKDQFDVIANKDFTVSVFSPNIEITNAYSFLSGAMSIRFKKDEKWDNVDIYKNDYNTLACEENKLIAYGYTQMFKPEDIITTQFLSNYENISVNILLPDAVVPVPVSTEIRFIELSDRRDGNLFQHKSGKAGVYFTTGNIYDYSTGALQGTFALNGALPEYVAKGNYMNIINSGWYEIIDIVFDESINADVAILDYNYIGAQKIVNVASLYNQNNYNVYEFTIDMAIYTGKQFQVEIKQSMVGFDDYNYLSEFLYVGKLSNDYYEFQWANLTDSNVFYSTGIKNKANLIVLDFDFINESVVDVNRTNKTTVLIGAQNYDDKELTADPLPTAMASLLLQSLLHTQLCINKVRYTPVSSPQLEPIQNTNLYSVSVQLARVQ